MNRHAHSGINDNESADALAAQDSKLRFKLMYSEGGFNLQLRGTGAIDAQQSDQHTFKFTTMQTVLDV